MSDQEPTSVFPNPSPADKLRELLPSYALGMLTLDEHQRVLQLLEQYPEMEAELDAYLALGEGLLLNVEPMQPSPSVRTRLMDQLAAEETAVTSSHEAPTSRFSSSALPSLTAPKAVDTPPASTITQTAKRVQFTPGTSTATSTVSRNRTPFRIAWGLAAACLALLLVTNVYWFAEADKLRTEVQSLQDNQENIVANLLSESVHQVALHAADTDTSRIATIAWNEDTEEATFYGGNLPEIASDQVYQLWLINDDAPVSAAVFTPDIQGSFNIFHTEMAGYSAVALTVEPRGGSDAPTTQPFAIAELG